MEFDRVPGVLTTMQSPSTRIASTRGSGRGLAASRCPGRSPGRATPRRANAVPSGLEIPNPSKGHKHFLHIDDWSADEVRDVLKRAQDVKAKIKSGDTSFQPFKGKTMSMIFTKQSMRTRVSFETVSRDLPPPLLSPPRRPHARVCRRLSASDPRTSPSSSPPPPGLPPPGRPRRLPRPRRHLDRKEGGDQGRGQGSVPVQRHPDGQALRPR